jgi:hypothetical protein|nr:MAG TPA: hypothetical protein [Caudoviricetes sp.]
MSETKTKNLCTVPAADLTDSQYFIAEDGGELKRIPKAQVVLKKLENMLATDTENLAGGGEVTAQELLDALAEQVANKLLAKSQVVNNLLATVEGNPLDATQGKALKELIDTTNNNLSKFGNLRFLTANTFADAWNKAEAGYTYFIDITSNTDPPTTTANRWFGQMWKNDTGKYGWQVAWSFNGTIYKRERNNSDAWTDWNTYALKSDLDSSKLKSMTFTAMSDEYAQIAIGNPGILICAVSNNYLLARQDNGVCRVIGDIRNNELSFKRNVKVSGIAFYV